MRSLKDLNWNHLYYFFEVARNQSLKKAAVALNVSPSNLSEQLKKLETELGKLLFKRTNRGLQLTESGHELYEHAKYIFDEGSKLLEKFSENVIGGYPVTVGIEDNISYDIPLEFVAQYWDLYAPFGTVNTIKQPDGSALCENLASGNIDWGISMTPSNRKNLNSAKIGEFQFVFLCSEELYEKFISQDDILKNIPMGWHTWDKTLSSMIYQFLGNYQIFPKEVINSDHRYYLENLCRRGRCLMCVPENPVGEYNGLKKFSLDSPLKISFFAVWKKCDEGTMAIQKLSTLIQSNFSQFPARYEDIELQIEVSDIEDSLLR